ncbi:hypothetical protein EV121DRAFT_269695 [Schizophyllum commune]
MPNPTSTAPASAGAERLSVARPYEEEDLKNLKVKELRALMESQPDALAYALKNGFKKANATKTSMKAALLANKFSFTTTKPRSEFVPGYGIQQKRVADVHAPAADAPLSGMGTRMALEGRLAQADGLEHDNAMGHNAGAPLLTMAPGALTLYLKDLREAYYNDVPPELAMVTVPVQQDTAGSVRLASTFDVVAAFLGARQRMSPNGMVSRLPIFEWSGSEPGLTADDVLVPQIFVPDNLTLMFYVEKSAHATRLAEGRRTSTQEFRAASLDELRPLATGEAGGSPFMDRMRWLEDQLHLRAGWHDFLRAKNSNSSNAEIIKYWTFAVTFRDEYTKRRYPVTGERVTNQDVCFVIGRGESWFRDATEGYDLYQAHCESPAVLSVVNGGVRHGAGKLLNLLRRIDETAREAAGEVVEGDQQADSEEEDAEERGLD